MTARVQSMSLGLTEYCSDSRYFHLNFDLNSRSEPCCPMGVRLLIIASCKSYKWALPKLFP